MRVLLPLLIGLTACGVRGEATLSDWDCVDGDCPTCSDDADCVVSHNPCQANAICAHVDANVAVTLEGCSQALEYGTPPDSDCLCDATSSCTPTGAQ